MEKYYVKILLLSLISAPIYFLLYATTAETHKKNPLTVLVNCLVNDENPDQVKSVANKSEKLNAVVDLVEHNNKKQVIADRGYPSAVQSNQVNTESEKKNEPTEENGKEKGEESMSMKTEKIEAQTTTIATVTTSGPVTTVTTTGPVTTVATTGPVTTSTDRLVKSCVTNLTAWYDKGSKKEIIAYADVHCKQNVNNCSAPTFTGPLFVNKEKVTLDWLYQHELQHVQMGGWWSPSECDTIQMTAIVIPFRDRYQHLPILLRQVHPMLSRNLLHYRIFIIEQEDEYSFNRGKLMNVGFKETLKLFPYSCFVFHDVDLVPEDDRINYACKISPAHLSVAIDKFNYVLPYASIFGGIEMFRKEDFEKVNGFPNLFWHWGGEDDNLYFRTKSANMKLHRQSVKIARYVMLSHKSNEASGNEQGRVSNFLSQSYQHIRKDGLNSLEYDVLNITEHQLYTSIKVNLRKDKDKL